MFVTKVAAFTVLMSSSVGFADLANHSIINNNGNAATDALTRIAASKQFEGASIAALDPGTNLDEDFVYYSTLGLKTEDPDLGSGLLDAGGGGGGGGVLGGGGGGVGGTDPGANGAIGGGSASGSDPGPTGNTAGGRTTPSPGAAILALIGMACVGGA